MAVRKVSEGVSSWNNKTPFPRDRYSICCVGESLEISKDSKNPMVKREWEIVAPESVELGDRTINTAGLKLTTYAVVKVHGEDGESWDSEKSDKAFGRFVDELKLMGFDGEEIDDENPPLFAKGKVMDAIIYGREDVARRSPTPEQLRQGRRVGDEIKDANGNKIKTYQLQIESILGPSSIKINTPY